MQVRHLHRHFVKLQKAHGHRSLLPIFGAGCINRPYAMLVFMNPTGKNIASVPTWNGLRAPWLGTKNVWKLLYQIGVIGQRSYEATQTNKSADWTPNFCQRLYEEITANNVYITNLAKCTQLDARPLSNSVFQQYINLFEREVETVSPKNIITFGNQVSSLVLNQNVTVSSFNERDHEMVTIRGKSYPVFPTWYPVGQGMRNLPKAVRRLKAILAK